MMGQFEQLDQMLTAQEGMLRTSQVVSSGISKPVFYDYVRSRDLDRVAHGIYLSKDFWVDAMYLLLLPYYNTFPQTARVGGEPRLRSCGGP